MISYLLIYLLIVIEFFLFSLFFYFVWKKYRRRIIDKNLAKVSLLMGISFLLFSLEFLGMDTKAIQLIWDSLLAIGMGYHFIRIIHTDLKNIKK